ncbi:MAG: hypothetical protein VB020_04965 [Methanocorpusculum sp.]|nr:hypothetical protein [Methanocorpusculum sp.]
MTEPYPQKFGAAVGGTGRCTKKAGGGGTDTDLSKIEDSCQMVRQVFAGEFRQSKEHNDFDFGI